MGRSESKLEKLLETSHGRAAFAEHLKKEMAIENLRFYNQVQRLKDSASVHNADIEDYSRWTYAVFIKSGSHSEV